MKKIIAPGSGCYRRAKSNAQTRKPHGDRYLLFINASAISDFIGPSKTLVLISTSVRARVVVVRVVVLGLATLACFVVLIVLAAFALLAIFGLLLLFFGSLRRLFVDAVLFAMNFSFYPACTKPPPPASADAAAQPAAYQ